ncbi:MAG TPA: hypothetical protein PKE05_16355 [Microthrixaceae bacterium]|nr:hypothetical protein [Microthrixaceae bacterium]
MTDPARTLHVERTADPTVLRWVCHRTDLDDTPVPPPDSLLSTMIEAGIVELLTIIGGDLLIRFVDVDDVADHTIVGGVHRAVGEALPMGGWSPPSGVTCVEVRSRRPPDPDPAGGSSSTGRT